MGVLVKVIVNRSISIVYLCCATPEGKYWPPLIVGALAAALAAAEVGAPPADADRPLLTAIADCCGS